MNFLLGLIIVTTIELLSLEPEDRDEQVAQVMEEVEGPKDQVILLPESDGKVGRVIITTSLGEQELKEAYASAEIDNKGTIDVGTTDQETVNSLYGQLLLAQPKPPRVYRLYFDEGSNQLTEESLATLEKLKRDVGSRSAAEVIVVGYTDRKGNDAYNDRLSLIRADAIAKQFIASGIKPIRLETVGRGERFPLVPTDDGVAEPRNRRAEVTVR